MDSVDELSKDVKAVCFGHNKQNLTLNKKFTMVSGDYLKKKKINKIKSS